MSDIRNILFIMTDQLRWDYLNCAGMENIRTPAIDALARRGVRFTQAHVQATVCGPSRMCFLTGRYAVSHGATYNNYPLPIDEWTIGDYLVPQGLRTALIGKTHMAPDRAAMERLGIDPTSDIGIFIRECGLEPVVRDDGLHPDPGFTEGGPYHAYLKAKGYEGHNLWHEIANSARNENGDLMSGWYMRHAAEPAVVAEEHSETAWVTDRAIDFITESGDDPWCLHLSYIKPHWPYIAPSPYHQKYTADDVPPANRSKSELVDPHPLVDAFRQHDESQAFSRDTCRETVIPTYMGLIEQIDDHIGRLMQTLWSSGRMNDTLIVFTSDHGDYLGDHWLGEKELFYDSAVRIPMIVVDPRQQADASRGTEDDSFVESIDLLPTFIDAVGGDVSAHDHRLEGRSLIPLLHGEDPEDWRDVTFCECDYSLRHARRTVGLSPDRARGWMVRTRNWKYVIWEDMPPQLFDLQHDPNERADIGRDPRYKRIRSELHNRMFDWLRARKTRTGISNREIEARTGKAHERGYLFGLW